MRFIPDHFKREAFASLIEEACEASRFNNDIFKIFTMNETRAKQLDLFSVRHRIRALCIKRSHRGAIKGGHARAIQRQKLFRKNVAHVRGVIPLRRDWLLREAVVETDVARQLNYQPLCVGQHG